MHRPRIFSVVDHIFVAGKQEEEAQQIAAEKALDHEVLYNALERAVRTRLLDMAVSAIKACSATLSNLETNARRMQALLELSGQQLHVIEQALRI
ncbi:hypothetical protein WJ968_31740 [Achromobacter xylosoxidans]